MKIKPALAMLLLLRLPVMAHRLDEYLEAALIAVKKDRVHVSMRLVPGVAVAASVIGEIDSSGDGVISEAEGRAYARSVLRDLSLEMDGRAVAMRLDAAEYPNVQQMKEGLGEIQIEFKAELPAGGTRRRLAFENRHKSSMAAYLVNCLVPRDPSVRILGQIRNENQSLYRLDYIQAAEAGSQPLRSTWRSGLEARLGPATGLSSLFRLGIRHIREGTDHLLFLVALLLPAPLMAAGARWWRAASLQDSILRILKIVTAFTVGHSVTLALAALGVVQLPGRPVEILIAVSILVSAVHAIRPIFPGREAWIAAFFGLIHGLAFAAALQGLGLNVWQRLAGILSFNLGIETMQVAVVAATMPSLLLLSRTPIYRLVRLGGGVFAGLAAGGWIAERLPGAPPLVDTVVNRVADESVWIAGGLFALSVWSWLWMRLRTRGGGLVSENESRAAEERRQTYLPAS